MNALPANATATTNGGDKPQPGGHPKPPTVPEYDLLRRIGGGAYGDVWLGCSVATGVLRAVKIVHRARFADDRPFNREFEAIKKFEAISRSHPSQIALFQVGRNEAAGSFYYVMELADDATGNAHASPQVGSWVEYVASNARPGTNATRVLTNADTYTPHTLRADLEHGRLSAARVLELGSVLTEALAHLHGNGLIHRDIKPSNIIFVGGKPKLADIGLVTDASDTCSIVGTEGYLPPEGPGTPQGDLFALGKVLYECATGLDRRQFPQLPPDLRAWPDETLVFELNEIILKSCAAKTEQRYRTCAEMHKDWGLLAQGKSVKRQRTRQQGWVACQRVGLSALGLAAIIAATILALNRGREEDVRSSNPDVNDNVQQGEFCQRSGTPERLNQAAVFFNQAIKLDPTFVPAFWGLVGVGVGQGGLDYDGSAEQKQNLRTLAAKLKQIAPDGAESCAAAAIIKWVDWDFQGALAEGRAATKRLATSKSGRSDAHGFYGFYLLETGHPAEALVEYQIAERLNSSNPGWHFHLGHPYFVWRKFDQALHYYQDGVDLEPRNPTSHFFKGRVHEEKGDFNAAIQEFEKHLALYGLDDAKTKLFFQELSIAARENGAPGYWTKRLQFALKDSPPDFYYTATLYAHLGEMEQAYAVLKKACQKRSGHVSDFLLLDACWDHNDPQFQAIARGIGLLR